MLEWENRTQVRKIGAINRRFQGNLQALTSGKIWKGKTFEGTYKKAGRG